MHDHKDSPEIRDIIFAEARRRDMCQVSDGSVGNNQATATASLNKQSNSIKPAPKFAKGDVVYLRATVTEVGSCGDIGVAVQQPGDKVFAQFIPAEKEIFKAKRQPAPAIILEN
jgi:hypothetical protein